MNKETNASLKAVKDHLKQGGTYFDTLMEAGIKAVVDALSRSAVNVDLDIAKQIGRDATSQFLNHWVGGQDAEVPDVDPNNPLQRSVDGTPAPILHPSKEDDHEIPAFVGKMKEGEIPAPPPGVPAAYTPEEEKAMLHVTGTPENAEVLSELNKKNAEVAKSSETEKQRPIAHDPHAHKADQLKAEKKK